MQWQFLSRDEGEVDTGHDPSWIEDEGTSLHNRTCTEPLNGAFLHCS